MQQGTCKGCGAAIMWIKTSAGKSMPCDFAPVPYWANENGKGRVVTPSGLVRACDLYGEPGAETGKGYISHFATCSKAGQFRKERSK